MISMSINIRYDVYLNGAEDAGGPITAYGVFGENTVEVIARILLATHRRRPHYSFMP
jgi:hypothetical protein